MFWAVVLSLVISGTPTASEIATIQQTWSEFNQRYGQECLTAPSVIVVDRVEDHTDAYPGVSLAAFYRTTGEVYVEHGKVTPTVLAHEFAHHLQYMCGDWENQTFDEKEWYADGIEEGWRENNYSVGDTVDRTIAPAIQLLNREYKWWRMTREWKPL